MERSRQRLAWTMGGCGLSFQGDMKEQLGVCLGGDRHMALGSSASSDSRCRFMLPMRFSSADGGNLQNEMARVQKAEGWGTRLIHSGI